MQDKAIAPEPASFLIRLAASVYEILLVAAVIFIASMPFAPFLRDIHSGWLTHLYQLYLFAVLFAYFAAFWMRSGQTLAMKTWRIRLTDERGGPLDLRRALLRFAVATALPLAGMALVYALGGSVASVGWGALAGWAVDWFTAFGDSERRFLHDRIAGTRMVRVPRKA